MIERRRMKETGQEFEVKTMPWVPLNGFTVADLDRELPPHPWLVYAVFLRNGKRVHMPMMRSQLDDWSEVIP